MKRLRRTLQLWLKGISVSEAAATEAMLRQIEWDEAVALRETRRVIDEILRDSQRKPVAPVETENQ